MTAPQTSARAEPQTRFRSPRPRRGLRELIKVLRRHRSIVIATVAVVTLASALMANALTPRYTAVAAVAIEPGAARRMPGDRALIETAVRILESRAFAQQVVEALGLPDAGGLGVPRRDGQIAAYAEPLADWLPDSWLVATGLAKPSAAGAAIDPDAGRQALGDAVDSLLAGLSVARSGDSSVIDIAYSADSPQMAATIANALASLFVEIRPDSGRSVDASAPDGDPARAGARVISSATVPGAPSFPRPRLMIAVGFTGSLMLGMLLAIAAEGMDSSLRSGRQVEQALGVPHLGLIPQLAKLNGDKPHAYLLRMPRSAYAEAVRAVQVGLQFSDPDRPPQVILVTSSLPGEGKTTLTLSLAASIARSGRKTIVVDLDMRHPSIRRELGQAISGPGLVEAVSGESALDDVIWRDGALPNLHAIPVGSATSNPTDLLASPRLSALLTELRSRYEVVILDAPPLLGLVDTRVAAGLADAVLLAVRWGETSAEAAVNGMDSLRESRPLVAGAVLTQVDVRSHTRRAYGDALQYYDKYEKYYLN